MTCWWFFAAALIMAGPPMSMFSTAVSYEGACSAVTVCRKGYRFTTTCDHTSWPSASSSLSGWPHFLDQPWMSTLGCASAAAHLIHIIKQLETVQCTALRPLAET